MCYCMSVCHSFVKFYAFCVVMWVRMDLGVNLCGQSIFSLVLHTRKTIARSRRGEYLIVLSCMKYWLHIVFSTEICESEGSLFVEVEKQGSQAHRALV